MSSDEDILMEKTQRFAKNNKKLENLILKYFVALLLGNHNRQGKKETALCFIHLHPTKTTFNISQNIGICPESLRVRGDQVVDSPSSVQWPDSARLEIDPF